MPGPEVLKKPKRLRKKKSTQVDQARRRNVKKTRAVHQRHSQYFVYMVKCATGQYYTGYTHNLEKRILKHNSGHGAKYLRGKLPVTLIYTKEYKYYKNALVGEKKIKKLSRPRKERLVKLLELSIHHDGTLGENLK